MVKNAYEQFHLLQTRLARGRQLAHQLKTEGPVNDGFDSHYRDRHSNLERSSNYCCQDSMQLCFYILS